MKQSDGVWLLACLKPVPRLVDTSTSHTTARRSCGLARSAANTWLPEFCVSWLVCLFLDRLADRRRHRDTLIFLPRQAQVCCHKNQHQCAKAFCAAVSVPINKIRMGTVQRSRGVTVQRYSSIIRSKFAKVTYDSARRSDRRWVVRSRTRGTLTQAGLGRDCCVVIIIYYDTSCRLGSTQRHKLQQQLLLPVNVHCHHYSCNGRSAALRHGLHLYGRSTDRPCVAEMCC